MRMDKYATMQGIAFFAIMAAALGADSSLTFSTLMLALAAGLVWLSEWA